MSRLAENLVRHAKERPGTIAIAGHSVDISYGELDTMVTTLTHQLKGLLPESGCISAVLDNGPAIILLDLVLARLGRIFVPLPPFFTEAQRDNALLQSGASCLIVTGSADTPDSFVVGGETLALARLPFAPVAVPRGTAKITFTSGSTGAPKGVCLSQAMMEETAAAIVEAIGAEHAGLHCALLPLAVLLENVAGLYAVLMAGGTYLVRPLAILGFAKPFAPDFPRLVWALGDLQANSAILVPELLRGLVSTLEANNQSLPALTFLAVGGAGVSPKLLADAAALDLPVFEGYGLSEAGSVVSLNTHRHNQTRTAGRLLAHVRASIAGDGELLISHPVHLGFAGSEAAPGILATGDLVESDTEGYLRIEGRKSALLITGFGRNVSPEWVEQELLAQPAIRQALVFGNGAASLSALIVPKSAEASNTEMQAAVDAANALLPDYASVRAWSIAEPFSPANDQLTSNGRLRRAAILRAYAGKINSQP